MPILLFLFLFLSLPLGARQAPFEFSKSVQEQFEEGDPTTVVHGCVHVISGMYCDSPTDLTLLHGVNPYHFTRTWSGSTRFGRSIFVGWMVNNGGFATYNEGKRRDTKEKVRVIASSQDRGGTVYFVQLKSADPRTTFFGVDRTSLDYGVTNISQGYASGQTNIKNWKAKHDKNIVVTTGEGERKEYEEISDQTYGLVKDSLPSGNKFLYEYREYKKRFVPERLRLVSQKGELEYAIAFPSLKKFDKHLELVYSVNSQQWVKYGLERELPYEYWINSVESSHAPTVNYEYQIIKRHYDEENHLEGVIKKKSLPDGRFLEAEYYEHGHNAFRSHSDRHIKSMFSPKIGRVRCLKAPAGPGNSVVPLYYFSYHLDIKEDPNGSRWPLVKGGSTHVYDAYDRATYYCFNEEQRLVSIDKLDAKGDKYTQERFVWGRNDTPESTYLLARSLHCANGEPLYVHTYQYDQYGNVTVDGFYGQLTGLDAKIPELNGRDVTNGAECYQKVFTYSQDGFNLPLTEFDGTSKTTYCYAKGTNRLIAKYVGSENEIYQRWFYKHAENGAITEEVCDDGSSLDRDDLTNVTERKMTRYTLRKTYPVAYPDVVEEWCLDLQTGTEQLIKKVVNTYSTTGKIEKQTHYGSDGKEAYQLTWKYDQYQNVIRETDPLGREIERKFDLNCNCIYEKGPRSDAHKQFVYDAMNRLICEEQYHSDGVCLKTHHRYDIMGNRISTIDGYGNETKYVYDDFNRLVKTILPPTPDEEGVVKSPVLKKTYDPLGNATSETDAMGHCTQVKTTLRKQPALLTFPDGSVEENIYNLNGTLAKKVLKNGTSIVYAYDPLGRVVQTETLSPEGGTLKTTKATYSGFHLLTETDAMGVITLYEYYPNGKLKIKTHGDRMTTYEYDELGRPIKTTEVYGDKQDDLIVHLHQFDLLDRVLEEIVQDGNGKIAMRTTYGYDVSGNIKQVSVYTPSGKCTTSSKYDSHGTPIEIIDAQGNITTTRCNYTYKNGAGQTVGYKEVTDPLGNVVVTIQDVLGRVVQVIKKDPFGAIVFTKENVYDLNGNCRRIVEQVNEKQIITEMTYDSMNRLTATYQAFGTPEQKVFSVSYTSSGNKEKCVKPDGTTLAYSYDPLERLVSVTSSDHTIHDLYAYDLHDNVIQIDDLVRGLTTRKSYDSEGRLRQEVLGNGLSLEYAPDYLGRARQVTLPDHTAVSYDYGGSLLKAVNRLDAHSQVLYAHVYEEYDQAGRVLQAEMPGNAGKIHYTYDSLGRLTQIDSKGWSEQGVEYDKAGNLTKRNIKCETESQLFKYAYDTLYQLTLEEGAERHEYVYDTHYNRFSKNQKAAHYNLLDQLIDDGESTYSYDLNGNLANKDSRVHYRYDAYDRLISVADGEQTTTYVYDALHRRLSKSTTRNGQTEVTRYLYQGRNEIGSVDASGAVVELRLLGVGKGAEIGASVAFELHGNTYVPLHDHNGNVAALIDPETGLLVEHYTYTAFGEYEGEPLSPWLFSSKRHDPETGFVYFGRRYYDPASARWITEDPLGREAGPNRYAFVHNNPLTHIDLYGLLDPSSTFADRFSTRMGQIASTLGNAARFLGTLPGRSIELIGANLVPIPGLKDIVAFAGHCLQGRNPSAFTWDYQKTHSQYYFHPGYGDNPLPHRIAYMNGMMTSFAEFQQKCADISTYYGGAEVHGIYNASHGLALDCLEYLCQKLGIKTHAQEVADQTMSAIIDGNPENPVQKHVHLHAHSQGSQTAYNLPAEVRSWTTVSALGPSRILSNRDFVAAFNYSSAGDFIPYVDPLHLVRGSQRGNVYFSQAASWNPFANHSIDSPFYSEVIRYQGSKFQERVGFVEGMGPR